MNNQEMAESIKGALKHAGVIGETFKSGEIQFVQSTDSNSEFQGKVFKFLNAFKAGGKELLSASVLKEFKVINSLARHRYDKGFIVHLRKWKDVSKVYDKIYELWMKIDSNESYKEYAFTEQILIRFSKGIYPTKKEFDKMNIISIEIKGK